MQAGRCKLQGLVNQHNQRQQQQRGRCHLTGGNLHRRHAKLAKPTAKYRAKGIEHGRPQQRRLRQKTAGERIKKCRAHQHHDPGKAQRDTCQMPPFHLFIAGEQMGCNNRENRGCGVQD